MATLEIWNGALHVHTTDSDGSGDVPQVLAAAEKAGLRFLLITDHNTLAGKQRYGDGYHGRLLVGFGVEVTPQQNHFLAFGIDEPPDPETPPEAFVAAILRRGGFGFVAHPLDRGSRLLGLPSYRWTAARPAGVGVELVNAMSLWVGYVETLPRALLALLWPERLLTIDPATMELWSQWCAIEPTPMIAGLDAHAWRFGPLTVFPYVRLFRMLQMYVYLQEHPKGEAEDIQLIYEALRTGRSFCAFTYLGEPEGFHFEVEGALPGERLSLQAKTTAHCLVPPGGRARCLQASRPLAEADHDLAVPITEEGPVWIEVYRGRRPWIITNPVYVGRD